MTSSGNAIYQIKVTLLWSSPPIWRRLLVPSDITLSDLHYLVQRSMGRDNSHLHEFHCRGKRYGPTDPEQGGPDRIDEAQSAAQSTAGPGWCKGRLQVRFR